MTQADAPSAEYPLVGQTIAGKYRILRLLGEGGMGCVYQGEQMLGTTARRVAVKTLHQHLSKDESVKARFRREVGTVAALEHPNTIQIYDFGEMPDGTLYIVMEFVQGRSVADILEKDGPMPPDRVENILRQVVGSLEEAHGHGIVHRDLKPDNVVLAERAGQKDWVEVLDFGIAKRSSEHDPNEAKLTQQGMVLGTPPYMSPEQFTGQPIDTRSDIYALGVMAYEMLSGKLPWEANTAWEWASKHMTEAPTPLERQPLGSHVPPRMRDAIARALAKDKDQRFSSVRAFFEALSGGAAPATGTTGPSPVAIAPAGGTSAFGAPSGAPDTRMKTEMGAPAMNPMGGPPMGGHYGAPPSPAIPQGPPGGMVTASSASEKKGPPVLVIALAALAVLLIAGAGIAAAVGGKKKPTTAGGLELPTATATAEVPSSTTDTDVTPTATDTVASAAPLTPPAPGPAAANPKPAAPAPAKPPTPTPQPPAPKPTPKPDPPICQKARAARDMKGMSPTTIRNLEQQCRDQGGTP
ncbi:MAG: protein kinase [Labilithrix sp.]|nr:protein kinase [Labilithrix sp.]MCW5810581.1 protein kinase [Labilithrix sp.]